MFQKINKRLKNRKGFTLVELIVVIAVLGILASIAVPKFGGFTDKAKNAADEQLKAIIEKSVTLSFVSNDFTVAENGGTITIKNGTGDNKTLQYQVTGITTNNVTGNGDESTKFTELMNDLIDNKTLLQNHDNIYIQIDKNGNITNSEFNGNN
ncbi:prepilin-type N-terminal cleavage/methylation domain-containing protein [Crassaminicella indica]|uniref:Type II secretion system protein n=1 Tax=Crassaminicella indica TaxID=2855394 RepID=A0ABX8RC12_9CLOT|nr:prepilin-type N-terminal cleavage/methylation domain-containing protein [Crassaminicella indica]QXM05994.1 type II secretion system protein [Crassaminicella indica]